MQQRNSKAFSSSAGTLNSTYFPIMQKLHEVSLPFMERDEDYNFCCLRSLPSDSDKQPVEFRREETGSRALTVLIRPGPCSSVDPCLTFRSNLHSDAELRTWSSRPVREFLDEKYQRSPLRLGQREDAANPLVARMTAESQ
jgi:hypothetical protein